MTATQRVGDWFQTYSGKMFWPLDPHPEEVDIGDIAHSLALQCRFNGHVKVFYSVAQHSVLVASILPDRFKLWGLMHDAAEAYVGDMVRPLKLHQPDFREAEARVMAVIVAKYGLSPSTEPSEVKQADNVLLMTERRDLLAPPPQAWTPRAEPLQQTITAWSPNVAEATFLYWWTQYTA